MTHPSSPQAPMTAERLDQCAWLIECRIGPESTYIQLKSREELSQEWEEEIHARGYDAAKKLKPWHFTKDASSATRFAREEDAARAMVALGMQGPTGLLDWLRPTEHMWSDAAHPDVSNVPALTARVATLESELAAARKVEAGEVARAHSFALAATAEWTPYRATFVAGTIERLSAALKEARVDAGDAQAIAIEAEDHMIAANLDAANAIARAQAAEAKLESAYSERNKLVAFLAHCYPAAIARTAIEGWDPEWHWCVYINTPAGQMSWHYHDSDAHLFDDLPLFSGQWDGHTTEQKYDRLRTLQTKDTTP